MTTKNQNSSNSAETASFPAENLHVSEISATFAESKEPEEFKRHGRYVSPLIDFGFKRIFEEEDILREFLNDLLTPPSPISKVRYLNKAMTPEVESDRRAEYDLRCLTQDGTEFIVEMQNESQTFFTDRIIYYLSKAIAPQVNKGEKIENDKGDAVEWNYELHPVYGVFFTNFHLSGLSPRVIRRARFKVEETGEVFNDKVRIYTIELPCFKGKTEADSKTRIEKWIYNLLNMEDMTKPLAFQDEMPVFKRLATVAEIANMTKEEYQRYEYQLKQHRDRYAQLYTARESGLAEGEAKGRAEGEAEGIIKGEQKERRKNAIALKKQGVSSQIIASALGLTIDEVEALQ